MWDLINLQKVGVFGHSFGGTTTVVASFNDSRIDACINLDGWAIVLPEDVLNKGIDVPLLYIGREEWADTDNYSLLNTLIQKS